MGGRNFEEEFGQALFFVPPTPHYVARETKIEPDRRLIFWGFAANSQPCFQGFSLSRVGAVKSPGNEVGSFSGFTSIYKNAGYQQLDN